MTRAMNLYLLSRPSTAAFNVYTSAVVVASSEEEARLLHPDGQSHWDVEQEEWVDKMWGPSGRDHVWREPSKVQVTLLGTAAAAASYNSCVVVLASFSAG